MHVSQVPLHNLGSSSSADSLTMRFSIIPCGWLAEQDTFVRNCDAAAAVYLLVFDGRKSEKGERLESDWRANTG